MNQDSHPGSLAPGAMFLITLPLCHCPEALPDSPLWCPPCSCSWFPRALGKIKLLWASVFSSVRQRYVYMRKV